LNDTEYHTSIKRLPIGEIPKTRRPLMSQIEMNELLTGEVWVEEKLDGTLTWATWYPASPQQPLDLFYEHLRIRHSIFYDRLPAWDIILDVAEGNRVLNPPLREEFGMPPPLIERKVDMTPQYFLERLPLYLNRTSAFATESKIEGIVVKNYPKQLFGKVANIEFYKGIEAAGSYLKRRIVERNRLAPFAFNRRLSRTSFSLSRRFYQKPSYEKRNQLNAVFLT